MRPGRTVATIIAAVALGSGVVATPATGATRTADPARVTVADAAPRLEGGTFDSAHTVASLDPAHTVASLDSAHADRRLSGARRTDRLQAETGLVMTITSVAPTTLTEGRRLTMSGVVTNTSDRLWTDANVYLTADRDPATSAEGLDAFAQQNAAFGTPVNTIGLFDELGSLPPSSTKRWRLSVPFDDLPIAHVAGVFHVGATLLATNGTGRDDRADARASTLVPFLPSRTGLTPTDVVILLPVTAPVVRLDDGSFVTDRLAREISAGGRLRDLLDFALQARPRSLELVVDPALRQAVLDMTHGYQVQSISDMRAGIAAHRGAGVDAARAWMTDLNILAQRQAVGMLPWGTPDITSLATAQLPGILQSGVDASKAYAAGGSLPQTTFGLQSNASTTRRSLSISRLAGVDVDVVAQGSLPGLPRIQGGAYPPAQISVKTHHGYVDALVARSDIAGQPFTNDLSAVAFRQDVLAEAAVRAMTEHHLHTSVIDAPYNWDPGSRASDVRLGGEEGSRAVRLVDASTVTSRKATPYPGPLRPWKHGPGLSEGILDNLRRLRDNGRTYLDLLQSDSAAAVKLDQRLGTAAASGWQYEPKRGAALIHLQSKSYATSLSKVTITGPSFVALSSSDGRFPLTISNGLTVPVEVIIRLLPGSSAVVFASLDPVVLQPGQSRDIPVESQAQGSDLTKVRASLSTMTGRRFGARWDFELRSTHIGLVIWAILGLGIAAIFLTAIRRIVKRARGEGFKTRAESDG